MLQQLSCGLPLSTFLLQANLHKLLHLLWVVFGDPGRWFIDNNFMPIPKFELLLIGIIIEGLLASRAFNKRDPQTPQIRISGVIFALESFRRHVHRGSHPRWSLLQRVFKLCRNAKISNFHLALGIYQHVWGFYIPVDYLQSFMQKLQC